MKAKEKTVHYEVLVSKKVKGRQFGFTRRFVSAEDHPEVYSGMTKKEATAIGTRVFKVTTIYEQIK